MNSVESASNHLACQGELAQAGLRVEHVPFDEIPNQSKLFLAYQRDALALNRYYPNAVRSHADLAARADSVLTAYKADRTAICNALAALNRGWGATTQTLNNIERLRGGKCVAVVTGQQAGLFTGPLYTIYKALSAVKLAECLTARGTEAVPVFWIATEDHDFAEVASAEVIGMDCQLRSLSVAAGMHKTGSPVGSVQLDDSIAATVHELLSVLPDTEFSADLAQLLGSSWKPGMAYGDAFAHMLTSLLGQFGLVLLDPRAADIKRLSVPIYQAAAEHADEIASALVARSTQLEGEGFHAQVLTSAESFPLFYHTEAGERLPLLRVAPDRYQVKGADAIFSSREIADQAGVEPARFSPNVTLRSVVQDYLLPTIAYYGGAAEIAYFAQNAEVYRILDRPVTTILQRASMTIVERRTGRTLERFSLNIRDFFEGAEHVFARVVEENLDRTTAETFTRVEASINHELDELTARLQGVEPTLAAALDTGRRKINYQLNGLRTRFRRAQLQQNEATERQLEHAFEHLYPHKALQERHVNVTSMLARHGKYVLRWIYECMDIAATDHQVVYL